MSLLGSIFFTLNAMAAARRNRTLSSKYMEIYLYADLFQVIFQSGHELAMITKALIDYVILYKWGYPTKLLTFNQGKTYAIFTLKAGP